MTASTATLNMVMKAQDKASGVIGRVSGSLGTVAKVAGGAVVAGFGMAAAAATKFALDAAGLPAIAQGFETNMEKYGLAAEEMQARLEEASAGTVNSFKLMADANLALTGAGQELGQEFGKSLPELMEIARAAARNTGQDVDFLFNSIVTGVKRASPMIIDNLGIVLKVGEANEAYAASLGKSVEELTAQERSIAILNATLEAGQGILDTVNLQNMTAAERVARLKTKFSNLKDELGLKLQPVLERVLEIAEPLFEKFAEWALDWLPIVGNRIMETVDKLQTIGSALAEAGVFSSEFGESLTLVFGEENQSKIFAIQDFIKGVYDRILELVTAFKQGGILGLLMEAFGPETTAKIWPFVERLIEVKDKISDVVDALIEGGIPAAVDEAFGEGSWGKVQEFIVWLEEHKKTIEAVGVAIATTTILLKGYNAVMAIAAAVTGIVVSPVVLLGVALGVLAGVVYWAWDELVALAKAFMDLDAAIREHAEPGLKIIWQLITGDIIGAFETAKQVVINLKNSIGTAVESIKWYLDEFKEKIDQVKSKLQGMVLPPWMTPGSPTPLEIGLRGINKEMNRLSSARLPKLQTGLASVGGGTGSGSQTTSRTLRIDNVNINNGMDLNQFRAMLRRTLG
ncbi:MAG: hypothetical protein U9N61_02785 [Euryarchaeota archaeon]|nr:hypothetical protein [Euryarchaeota archaeon]